MSQPRCDTAADSPCWAEARPPESAPAVSGHPAAGSRWLEYASLPLLVVLWYGAAAVAQSRFVPGPVEVAAEVWDLVRSGPLAKDFGLTMMRAMASFVVAMALGSLVGLGLGRIRWLDRLFAPWVVVGLNIPAIVVAIVCYIWLGLTNFALVLAVVINKTPLVATMMREGVRALSADYDELATTFRMPRGRYLRLVLVPQLMPYLLAAARAGLALVWKMVLVFEILGSDGGVGFRVGVYFQFFDMKGILAYATCFVVVIMVIEYGALRPLEQRVLKWRADLD